MKRPPQPVPALDEAQERGWFRREERINVVPRLLRRASAQVLVRPKLVVPITEFAQRQRQCCAPAELPLLQQRLERAGEALDAPVLPRAVQTVALMTKPAHATVMP